MQMSVQGFRSYYVHHTYLLCSSEGRDNATEPDACAQLHYSLALDIPSPIFLLLGMADELSKLQTGIPEVMAKQRALLFAFRICSLELDIAKAFILVLYGRLRCAVRVGQVIGEQEAWRRGEDVFGLIVSFRCDYRDQGAQRGLEIVDGHGESGTQRFGLSWDLLLIVRERGSSAKAKADNDMTEHVPTTSSMPYCQFPCPAPSMAEATQINAMEIVAIVCIRAST